MGSTLRLEPPFRHRRRHRRVVVAIRRGSSQVS